MTQFATHPTAQLIADEAHDARNQLATLRAAVELLDDPAARADAHGALNQLVRQGERLGISARIELDDAPEHEPHDVATLLEYAVRRAQREGAPAMELVTPPGTTVFGPGVWLERLFVDLLHARSATGALTLDGAVVHVEVDVPADIGMIDWLGRLAHATESTLDVAPGELTISLPTR